MAYAIQRPIIYPRAVRALRACSVKAYGLAKGLRTGRPLQGSRRGAAFGFVALRGALGGVSGEIPGITIAERVVPWRTDRTLRREQLPELFIFQLGFEGFRYEPVLCIHHPE